MECNDLIVDYNETICDFLHDKNYKKAANIFDNEKTFKLSKSSDGKHYALSKKSMEDQIHGDLDKNYEMTYSLIIRMNLTEGVYYVYA
jgi:hypothetical protein